MKTKFAVLIFASFTFTNPFRWAGLTAVLLLLPLMPLPPYMWPYFVKIPADGVVLRGHAAVDASMVTGESMPVHMEEGSDVIGATVRRFSTC